jgi:hypothetical protein
LCTQYCQFLWVVHSFLIAPLVLANIYYGKPFITYAHSHNIVKPNNLLKICEQVILKKA